MANITIQFSDRLAGLQRAGSSNGVVLHDARPHATVKDIIESMGVPHTEVGEIERAGEPVPFDYRPEEGDHLRVYPLRPPVDVTRPTLLRPEPLEAVRFIVDVNVGGLAPLLRMLGQDTAYDNRAGDGEIAARAEREGRIVLSRDTALLKRKKIAYGRLVLSVIPYDQLAEVVGFFRLPRPFSLFSRCLVCNRLLAGVEKDIIRHRLEPKTERYFHDFKICPGCDRIYWRGSHYEAMLARLQKTGVLPGAPGDLRPPGKK